MGLAKPLHEKLPTYIPDSRTSKPLETGYSWQEYYDTGKGQTADSAEIVSPASDFETGEAIHV